MKPTLLFLSFICTFAYLLEAETIFSSSYPNSLQEAIDAFEGTGSENILIIERGTYYELLTISENNITIKGEETAQSILTNPDSNDTTAVITVTGDAFVNILNLTFSSANLGIELSSGAQGNINNNIFSLGSTNIAFSSDNLSAANIFHNTFFQNNISISANATLGIKNNVFIANSSSNSILGLSDDSLISFNLFLDEPDGNIFGSDNISGNSSTISTNFISSSTNNFHVSISSSNLVNAGNSLNGNDSIDNSLPNLGAYGGNLSDTIPSKIDNVSLSSNSTNSSNVSATVSWNLSNNYRVKGYLLFSGNTSDLSFTSSNIIISDNTTISRTLENQDASITLKQPTNLNVTELNTSLELSWNEVSGASNYIIEYKESGNANFDTSDPTIENSGTISGLTTGTEYIIRVRANVTPALYVAVTSYYDSENSDTYSDLDSSKASYFVTDDIQTTVSDNVSATPQETIPFPNLPNNGGGCLLRRNK